MEQLLHKKTNLYSDVIGLVLQFADKAECHRCLFNEGMIRDFKCKSTYDELIINKNKDKIIKKGKCGTCGLLRELTAKEMRNINIRNNNGKLLCVRHKGIKDGDFGSDNTRSGDDLTYPIRKNGGLKKCKKGYCIICNRDIEEVKIEQEESIKKFNEAIDRMNRLDREGKCHLCEKPLTAKQLKFNYSTCYKEKCQLPKEEPKKEEPKIKITKCELCNAKLTEKQIKCGFTKCYKKCKNINNDDFEYE